MSSFVSVTGLSNPDNGLTFTVKSGITNRSKIGSFKLIHVITTLADNVLKAFKAWDFTIVDPCDSSLLTLTVTPSDATTKITVANTDTSLLKTV